ncbi:MAG: DUF1232 domain-containing protein [Bryobacteraceae bacterium]
MLLALILAAAGAWLFWRGAQIALRLWKMRVAAKSVLAILGSAAYTLSPVDVVPDMLFGIGWLDDLVVIAIAVVYIRSLLMRAHGTRRSTPASRATVEVLPQISAN